MPLFGAGALGVIVLCLWIFCLVDVITTTDGTTRNLPKMGWLLIVLFLPLIGSVLWLVAGRPQAEARGYQRSTSRFPEYERPGRHVAANPDDDEDFLRRCRERAEEQRRKGKPEASKPEESES